MRYVRMHASRPIARRGAPDLAKSLASSTIRGDSELKKRRFEFKRNQITTDLILLVVRHGAEAEKLVEIDIEDMGSKYSWRNGL